MYVNYFLLRTNEKKISRRPRYPHAYSPRFSSMDLSPILQRPKLNLKPRKLPPLSALNSSLPSIVQSYPIKPDKIHSYVSDSSSSSEEYQLVLNPKFFK